MSIERDANLRIRKQADLSAAQGSEQNSNSDLDANMFDEGTLATNEADMLDQGQTYEHGDQLSEADTEFLISRAYELDLEDNLDSAATTESVQRVRQSLIESGVSEAAVNQAIIEMEQRNGVANLLGEKMQELGLDPKTNLSKAYQRLVPEIHETAHYKCKSDIYSETDLSREVDQLITELPALVKHEVGGLEYTIKQGNSPRIDTDIKLRAKDFKFKHWKWTDDSTFKIIPVIGQAVWFGFCIAHLTKPTLRSPVGKSITSPSIERLRKEADNLGLETVITLNSEFDPLKISFTFKDLPLD